MLKAATRSPSPRNGFVVIPTAAHRMRGLFDRPSTLLRVVSFVEPAAAFAARGARERAAARKLAP
ncbi:MAG: hypothetical protein AABZ71_01135 [Candidatus Binatota bacterium]